jgi:hypothetical protein
MNITVREFLNLIAMACEDVRRAGGARPCPPPLPADAPAINQDDILYEYSHRCPNCGCEEMGCYYKEGRGPKENTHLHVCPDCGTTWWHEDR